MTQSIRHRIETEAQRMGASRAAIFKWRSRGIPSEWKLKLISAPDAFTIHELEEYERSRVQHNPQSNEAA